MAVVVLTGIIRLALIQSVLPWMIFSPVIVMVAVTLGRRVGFYALFLAAVTAAATIHDPGADRSLTGPLWMASIPFLLYGALLVVIGSELRAAYRRLRQLSEKQERNADEMKRVNGLLTEKEEQTQLLAGELGHRLKNLLAIVQAVASQTLRGATDVRGAADALSFRLAALGRAADVLTASTWEAAEMRTLVEAALARHAGRVDGIRYDGPSIRFDARIALALTLALHELATNATKYGALSNATGHVELHWGVHRDEVNGRRRFELTWQEIGGPPVVPPTRRGFGSFLIERSLRAYFRGEVSTDYLPSGLVFTIDAPLDDAGLPGATSG